MKILFFGSGAFGLPTLEWLAGPSGHSVAGVVTQPDRPAGRGGQVMPTPIGEFAGRLEGVAVFKAENVNIEPALEQLRAIPADVWLVIAFGQKLSPGLLDGKRAINLHASLLPRWRGAAPINAAILAGDAETGNSVITLADRMDAGLIVGQSRRTIDPLMTAGELHDALAADGPKLVGESLSGMASGEISGVTQDEVSVTRARKLSKADGWLDFAEGAQACRRRVHGLTPWPGVTVRLCGEPVKLLRVSPQSGSADSPASLIAGTLLNPSTGDVSCGNGTILRMLEVQPAGGRAMFWADFARGRRLAAGERFEAGRP
jgi:methionyl-tRNA formyltransferase